jgi:hypothetical protein
MMLSTLKRGRRLPLACGVAAALCGLVASAQTPANPPNPSSPPDKSDGAVVIHKSPADTGNTALDKAFADLGESPLAAIYEAAGPDARSFAQHDLLLSDPFFEGRFPGTRGNRLAADYIEYYFRQANLKPAFASDLKAADGSTVLTPNTSYRQTFSQGNEIKVEQADVTFDLGPGGTLRLKPEEFTVLGSSGSGSVTAPIMLLGYGIAGGPEGYTNYPEGLDLSGKIAVIFRFEPMDDDGKSRWTSGKGWSPAASLDTKIAVAAEHHAAGVILVNPPGADDARAKNLVATRESRPFGTGLTIPVVMATPQAVDRLVQAGDPTDGPRRTLLDFRKLADQHGGPIGLTNAKATLTTRMSYEPVNTDNVGAVLPGRGKLANQYLVIGAHYDHVGYGPVGTQPQNNGKVHPGADDNASGTSGVLVLADKLSRAYAALPENADARSILFLTFSAEESGLIGSHYWVNHPSVELSQVYLMLNMDMIGRLRTASATEKIHGLEVQGTESAEGLYDWLKPIFDSSGLEILHGPEVATNSDHASFYTKKLPVLFFFTGLHNQYHTPQDTGFTVNQIGAAHVIGLVYDIALAASSRMQPFKFTPRREEASADNPHADPKQPAPSRGAGRVRFGIMPASYSDAKPGIPVGEVYENTPAAAAGIKAGDRLMKWNGTPVPTVEDWMPLFTKQKAGDVVEVTVERDGKEMTFKVTLTARDDSAK